MAGEVLGISVFLQWIWFLQKLRVNARNSVESAVSTKMTDNKKNNNSNRTRILYSYRSSNRLDSCWVFSNLAYHRTQILQIKVKIYFSTQPNITKHLIFLHNICITRLIKRSNTCWQNCKNSMEKHMTPANYSSYKDKNKIIQNIIRTISSCVAYCLHS